MRILLVEDNLKLASTLEEALGQAGFTVDCVHDGHAADLLLTTQDYALAILDIGLPRELLDEVGADIARTAVVAPSALQLGLMRNLDQAEQLWRDWGWTRLREMRIDAIRHALDDDVVQALARDVLEVARAGLPAAERHWLAYADHALQTRRTGADRLLALWREHQGRGDCLARVRERREVLAL